MFVAQFHLRRVSTPVGFALGAYDEAESELFVEALKLAVAAALRDAAPRLWITAPWDYTHVMVLEPHRVDWIDLGEATEAAA